MKKALVVGINNYNDKNLNLIGCVEDAMKVSELLEKNGNGSPNFDIKTLYNVETQVDLKEGIVDLFSGDSDVCLFYFSGHGTDEDNGYIVTPDVKQFNYGVELDWILNKANESKIKNKIIILDSCFSGKFGESQTIAKNTSILGEGITIMTSSNRDQLSKASKDGSLFTNLFIEGLKGAAADVTGKITPASLYSFIDQSLGEWQQRPIFKTNISRFLPIREIESKVPKTLLRKLPSYFGSASDEFHLDPSFEITNDPKVEHKIIEPYCNEKNSDIFKELQLYQSVGLVEPVGAEHMYFAALESKSCKLTALGCHYWKLAKDKRF